MISTGEAKPLPPKLSHVMDNMFWWGKSYSIQWYDQVVDSMGALLDIVQVAEEQREFVGYFIAFEVKSIIQGHFDILSVAYAVIFDQWMYHFNLTYSKVDFDGTYTFRSMAEASFEYVEWLISEVEDEINVPVVVSSG
jgi:hypothetical protein